MPNALVKSFAKRSGKSVKRVEHYWDEAKEAAVKKFEHGTDSFWSYVNAIVQRRSGLREMMSFKDFLDEGINDDAHHEVLKKTGFFGKIGAGCVIVAEDTGKICMPFRSLEVEQPHTWGTWGGAVDDGEDAKSTAVREVREETGYAGKISLSPLFTFKHPSGFRYFNFLALVPEEFTPTLDWETEKAEWRALDDLPRPLHFGFKSILEDSTALRKLEKVCRSNLD
jgi:8-oxo-dGTP pyrophosphatase MutT (NUDIX family)